MPWYVIDTTKLTKEVNARMFCMRKAELGNYYTLDDMTYGKALSDKPTEIPAGQSLKFFPTEDDMRAQKARRQRQLESDDYTLPPWMEERESIPGWATHRNQMDAWQPLLTKDGKIEYFPSHQHWRENRPQVTTIGRFLRMIWAAYDAGWNNYATSTFGTLTDDMIRVWSEIPKTLTKEDVVFKSTPDEIEDAYLHGPSSCMSKPVDSYMSNGVHPSRVYGAGDLAVAVLPKRRGTGYGQRALVWPAKKIYSRIYGTGPLGQFLRELGYTSGTFDGAKLLKIKAENNIVLPYVDYHDFVVEHAGCLKLWHKHVPHECAPHVTVVQYPRTQRGVWQGGATTTGVVPERRKCSCCKCPLAIRDILLNGYMVCPKCLTNSIECNGCGQRKSKIDVSWRFIASGHHLQAWTTKKEVWKHRWELARYCDDRRCQERVNYSLKNYDTEYTEILK